MDTVWILWHRSPEVDAECDRRLVGVYTARDGAAGEVERLSVRPGFIDSPALVDRPELPGFFIEEHPLDESAWADDGLPPDRSGQE